MDSSIKRVSTRVTNYVDKHFDTLAIGIVAMTVLSLKEPYSLRSGTGTVGRPGYDPRYVAFCAILCTIMNRTYRKGEAYLKSVNHHFLGLFNETRVPSSTTIHDRFDMIPTSYLRKVNTQLIRRFRRAGFTLAVDSSGLRKTSASSWFCFRIGRRFRRKDHLKVHIGIDVDTGLIVAFKVTHGNASDAPATRSLLRQVGRIGRLLADCGYSARWIFEEVKLKGGIPYIPFRKNATGKMKWSSLWSRMFVLYTNEPDRWREGYSPRVLVESTFSTLKRCWGAELTARRGWSCRKEAVVRIIAHNVQRVAYLDRADELGIPLWQQCSNPVA